MGKCEKGLGVGGGGEAWCKQWCVACHARANVGGRTLLAVLFLVGSRQNPFSAGASRAD